MIPPSLSLSSARRSFWYLMCSHFGTKCVYATLIRALSSDSVIFVTQSTSLSVPLLTPRCCCYCCYIVLPAHSAVVVDSDQTTILNMKRAFKVQPTSQDKLLTTKAVKKRKADNIYTYNFIPM